MLPVSTSAISTAPLPARPWSLSAKSLTVFHGCPEAPRLSHYFLPSLLMAGCKILYLDGANRLDPLLIARFARERGRTPAEFNRQIRAARAFTCFQLTELLRRGPALLQRFPASVLMVTALPDLYFDEDVREAAAGRSFAQALEALKNLALVPLTVGVFSDATSFPSPRRTYWERLTACASHVVKIEPAEGETLHFTEGRAAARLRP